MDFFFGAGNLIFPVHMGQEAGEHVTIATLGFLLTAIGLPFLGVVAIGLSKSDGVFALASRIHPLYGYIFTVLLYLTIGPFFALPRTGTVSYTIGIAPFVAEEYQSLGLGLFTLVFFGTALFFSLRPGQILMWVGKVLTPLFLLFLTILIITSFIHPMGVISTTAVAPAYQKTPFFTGFIEGYKTMDVLASLAFGIVVVHALKGLGVTSAKGIALGTVKAGAISVLIMGFIYACLAYVGASSVEQVAVSENGGIALAQISQYYFGVGGSVLLACIVTFACLKTAIGLITACASTFTVLFPCTLGYSAYAVFFTTVAGLVANVGLTQIIALSVPILMFLYPLAIALVLLGVLSPLFKNRRCVHVLTTFFTVFVSLADGLQAIPAKGSFYLTIQPFLQLYEQNLPFFTLGMGWVVPMIMGFILGLGVSVISQPCVRTD